MINFVNTGADEAILKSMSTDGCSEDLIKAMNKQGLVQKDVTVQGKNGKTFTRKQWVKASDVQSKSTPSNVSQTPHQSLQTKSKSGVPDFTDAKKVRTFLRKVTTELGYSAPQYKTTSVRGYTPISRHGVKITGLVEPLKSDDKVLYITYTGNEQKDVYNKIQNKLERLGIKVIGSGEKRGATGSLTIRFDEQDITQSASKLDNQGSQLSGRFKPSDFQFKAGGQDVADFVNSMDTEFGVEKFTNGQVGFGTLTLKNGASVAFGYDDKGAYATYQGQQFRGVDDLAKKWGKTTSKADVSGKQTLDPAHFDSIKSDKDKALKYLKDCGIDWVETSHKGINWMRAMAAYKKVTGGQNPVQSTSKTSTQPNSQQSSQTAQVAQNTAGNGGQKLSKEDAKKMTQSYTSKVGKTEAERKAFMDKVKAQGITWKDKADDGSDVAVGVSWMRCCMAMNKHFAEGGSFDGSTQVTQDKKSDKSDSIDPKVMNTAVYDAIRKGLKSAFVKIPQVKCNGSLDDKNGIYVSFNMELADGKMIDGNTVKKWIRAGILPEYLKGCKISASRQSVTDWGGVPIRYEFITTIKKQTSNGGGGNRKV